MNMNSNITNKTCVPQLDNCRYVSVLVRSSQSKNAKPHAVLLLSLLQKMSKYIQQSRDLGILIPCQLEFCFANSNILRPLHL
jgi:hypothetical protein